MGCKDQSIEVEALRKELAELKAQVRQDQEKRKLQDEISQIREGELEGAVFIVTKSRENVKLGLVTVSLFDASQARNAVQQVRADLQNKSNEMTAQAKVLLADLEKTREEYNSANNSVKAEWTSRLDAAIDAYHATARKQWDLVASYEQLCVAALGPPVSVVKTDADGRFKLNMPRTGEFVLSASASREVGRSSETYYWIIAYSLDGKDRGQIFLSNDNEIGSFGATSIVERSGIKPLPYASRSGLSDQ